MNKFIFAGDMPAKSAAFLACFFFPALLVVALFLLSLVINFTTAKLFKDLHISRWISLSPVIAIAG